MIRAVLLAVVLLVLVAAVVLIATSARQPRAERPHRRLSDAATTNLVVLGMLAVGVAVVLGFSAGDVWPLLPLAVWIVIYLVVRERARTRPQRERAKAERQQQAQRQRVNALGVEGVALMDRADAAIDRIMSSEAATQGWLGQLDFSADVTMIAESLRRITALRTTAAEWAALPHTTADDERVLRDAQRAVEQLKAAVAERVKVLHDCAEQAQRVDDTLRRQREQEAVARQRDGVGSQLSAMINGVEMTPNAEPSESAEAVQARVAAFLDLKEIIEQQRRIEPAVGNADEP